MSKRQKFILVAVFIFTFSIFIHPSTISSHACTNSSYLTLLPPICYTEEMYNNAKDSEEHLSEENLQDDNIKIEIRFKIVELVVRWFEKILNKE